jgi:hypothetical protein
MRPRRRKKFIDSAVQGALIRRIVLHWLVFFTIAFFTLPLWQLMRGGEFLKPFAILMMDSWAESAPVFAILIALLPLFVWDTVVLSNRFAGPVYRLHTTIRKLTAGEEVPPIRLRKGDFWTKLADDFNLMVERLSAEQEGNSLEQQAKTPAKNEHAVPCAPCDGHLYPPPQVPVQ